MGLTGKQQKNPMLYHTLQYLKYYSGIEATFT